MNPKKLILSLLLLLPAFLPAQDQGYILANKVYRNIIEAIGDKGNTLPKLILSTKKELAAAYDHKNRQLLIDREAIKVCRSLGKDTEAALAFLIGHELKHFYQQEDQKTKKIFTGFLMGKTDLNDQKAEEQEADIHGAFVAYLAGYNTLDVIPNFLSLLYREYKIDQNGNSYYPSLDERKQVVEQALHLVGELIHLYETGLYLTAFNAHNDASYCFQFILKKVKSKELYQNLGTSWLSIAANLQESGEGIFSYPLYLGEYNFSRYGDLYTKQEALDKAIENLEYALNYDAHYFDALLNLACAYDLSGKQETGLKILGELRNLSTEQKARTLLLKGIIMAHKGDSEAAEKHFYRTRSISGDTQTKRQAQINIDILKGTKSKPVVPLLLSLEDQIEDMNPSNLSEILTTNQLDIKEEKFTRVRFAHKQIANSTLSSIKVRIAGLQRQTVLHRTSDPKHSTKRGIGFGSDSSNIEKAYQGIPSRVYYSPDGYFLVYPSLALAFRIDGQDKVREWGIMISN